MSTQTPPTLYIRLRKRVSLEQGEPVILGKIAQLIVDDQQLESSIKRLVIMKKKPPVTEQFVLIDMLMIVRAVKARYPSLEVEYYGEPHVLVEWRKHKTVAARRLWFPFALVLLFVGSGLTIMNFHADVSMFVVHRKLYTLVTGLEDPHPLILQIPYSIGLGIGMLLFFNRVFRKKLHEEPDPLEVEMYLYEENVRQFILNEEYQRLRNEEYRLLRHGEEEPDRKWNESGASSNKRNGDRNGDHL